MSAADTKTKTASTLLPLSKIRAEVPCLFYERIEGFTVRHGRPPDETSTVQEWLEATDRVSDLLWGLRLLPTEVAKRIAVHVATRAARRVLRLFEEKYPKDACPRHAIEVAEKWLENPESVRGAELLTAARVVQKNRSYPVCTVWAATDAAYAAAVNADVTWTTASAAAAAHAAVRSVIEAEIGTDWDNAYMTGAVERAKRAEHVTARERATQRQDFLDALELYLPT